jgi:hypothetical protein
MVTSGRLYSVFLLASAAPTSASVNGGAPLPLSPTDGVPGTYFRTPGGDTRVYLAPASTSDALSLTVCV